MEMAMTYAEQISFPNSSRGIFGRLVEWVARSGIQSLAEEKPVDEEEIAAVNADVAVDGAAVRQFSEYRTPAAARRGSEARLHSIANAISSTLPR